MFYKSCLLCSPTTQQSFLEFFIFTLAKVNQKNEYFIWFFFANYKLSEDTISKNTENPLEFPIFTFHFGMDSCQNCTKTCKGKPMMQNSFFVKGKSLKKFQPNQNMPMKSISDFLVQNCLQFYFLWCSRNFYLNRLPTHLLEYFL